MEELPIFATGYSVAKGRQHLKGEILSWIPYHGRFFTFYFVAFLELKTINPHYAILLSLMLIPFLCFSLDRSHLMGLMPYDL